MINGFGKEGEDAKMLGDFDGKHTAILEKSVEKNSKIEQKSKMKCADKS